MEEIIKIKEEISEECFSDCKFEDSHENVTYTPDHMKCEKIDINYNTFETERCSIVEEGRKPCIQIKKEINAEYSDDCESCVPGIKTDMDKTNNINTDDSIKFEKIYIKHEPLGNISVPCGTANEIIPKLHPESCDDKELTDLNSSKDTHKSIKKDVRMYTCDICGYKSKRRYSLNEHMFIHEHTQETYPCGLCSYKAKRKRYLKTHMLVHKDPSEYLRYKCDVCDYQARVISRLKRHSLIHKKAPTTKTSIPAKYFTLLT